MLKDFLLLAVLLHQLAMTPSRETEMTVVTVCAGDYMKLRYDFQKPMISSVKNVQFYRNGGGVDPIVVKLANNEPKLYDPRANFSAPASLIIRNATVADAGPYIVTVQMENNQTESHRFQVNVLTGCPDRTAYYKPDVTILDEDHRPLTNPADIGVGSTMTVKVVLPEASPNATCVITGHGLIGGSDKSPGQASFYFLNPGTYIINVRLEHPFMEAPSTTAIKVRVSDRPIETDDDPLVVRNDTEKNNMCGVNEDKAMVPVDNNPWVWIIVAVLGVWLVLDKVIQLVGAEKLKAASIRTWKSFKQSVRRDDGQTHDDSVSPARKLEEVKTEGAPEKGGAGSVTRFSMIVQDDNQEDENQVIEPLIHKDGPVPCSPPPARKSMNETKL